MMNFSWEQFCRANGISYTSYGEGPNVGRGNIVVHCPLCGSASTSDHMTLSLDPHHPFWYCWRGAEHRGRRPQRLIVAMLHCSYERAEEIVGAEDTPLLDDYEQRVANLAAQGQQRHTATPIPPRGLTMPTEFKPIEFQSGMYGKRFSAYLRKRGFDHVSRLAAHYGLRYCLVGAFAERLILPIRRSGILLSWTGRDISGLAPDRYKTLSDNPDKAARQGYKPALVNIKSTLFNIDKAVGGETLLVCEGPFDALKVDWFGRTCGASAVAVFGMPGPEQVAAIAALAVHFKGVAVVLDYAASGNAFRFVRELEEFVPACRWVPLPTGVKDPGDLTSDQVTALCREARKVLDAPKTKVSNV